MIQLHGNKVVAFIVIIVAVAAIGLFKSPTGYDSVSYIYQVSGEDYGGRVICSNIVASAIGYGYGDRCEEAQLQANTDATANCKPSDCAGEPSNGQFTGGYNWTCNSGNIDHSTSASVCTNLGKFNLNGDPIPHQYFATGYDTCERHCIPSHP